MGGLWPEVGVGTQAGWGQRPFGLLVDTKLLMLAATASLAWHIRGITALTIAYRDRWRRAVGRFRSKWLRKT
jgi:hypothetical protein